MSGITAYSAYLKDLPLYWIIPLTIATFCLFIWGLYGLGRLADWRINRKQKTDETISDTSESEIQKLKDHHEERETKLIEAKEVIRDELNAKNQSLREAHKKEIEGLNQQHANYSEEIEKENIRIKKAWDEKRWLMELAEKQAKQIKRYISIVDIGNVAQNFEEHHHIKSLIFYLRIRNCSVYEITFENNIEGRLHFRSNPLIGTKLFNELPPPVIQAGKMTEVYITQRLDANEVACMRDLLARRKAGTFHDNVIVVLDGLILKVKDSSDTPHFAPTPLEFATRFLDLENF